MALNEEERHLIEARLHEERERVQRILRRYGEDHNSSLTDSSGDISEFPFHMADRGTESYDQEMETVLAERASRELAEIDEALRRFYEKPDRFGICENTGEQISMERLELVPWTRTCMEARVS
jgi:RNA polymerase-binding transcription factor DksA